MKSRILLLFVPWLTFSFFDARCQDGTPTSSPSSGDSEKKFSIGIRAGGNVNKFSDTKFAFGYTGGLILNLRLSELIGIRSEVLYTSYAARLEDRQVDFSSGGLIDKVDYRNSVLRFHSVEPTLQLRFSPFSIGNSGVVLFLGGSYAYNFAVFNISDNLYTLVENNGSTKSTEFKNSSENVGSAYSQYNATVLGGIELMLSENLGVDIRYQQGIPNLNIQNLPNTLGSVKTNLISLGVNISF